MNNNNNLKNTDFEILWTDRPAGLWQRFLSLIHMNFTKYQITKDELLIQTGFFHRVTNTAELYTLKDPDLSESLYQRILGIGTITVKLDIPNHGDKGCKFKIIQLKNVRNAAEVRKLLRDSIEADVMERKITYFDRV